jgi:hypothetical protein
MERLNTDRSLAPLVAQFVPLKIETDGPQWGAWARKYTSEGNGIPIIYVIRADGEKLYGKSGALGDQLPLFLRAQLVSAGRILSPAELSHVQSAVAEAKEALTAGDSFTAVKRLDALKKIGPAGKLGSYAAAALEADRLVAQLTEEGKAALAAAKEKLAGDDKLEGALAILSANRIYGALPELKKELGTAERELKKDASLKETVAQAEAIDKALALVSTKNGKKAASEALAKIAARYPNSPAASLAQQKIEEISGDAPTKSAADRPGGPPIVRKWTDVTGTYTIEAELVEKTADEVKLKRTDTGEIVAVPVSKLSAADREFLKDK